MKVICALAMHWTMTFPSFAAVGLTHISGLSTNEFGVYQTFDKSDYTGFGFNFTSGSTFQYRGSFLDEGLDLYRVFAGDEFTPDGVTNGNFTKFLTDSNYNFPSTFYIALKTPSSAAAPFATLPPAYGWARVSNSAGVLAIEDHAIDYSGQGLIVGTTTVVPEPSVSGLILISFLAILNLRCRSSY